MPEVRPKETLSSYVQRYMGSEHSSSKPQKQRLAIAYSEYRRKKKKK